MATTLAYDGYALTTEVVCPPSEESAGIVIVRVTPEESACAECLVPESLFKEMVSERVGGRWNVEVIYPKGDK